MFGMSPMELIIVLVVVLLLFGSTRLPKLARSLGQASTEFKRGIGEGRDDAESAEGTANDPTTANNKEKKA